MSTNIHGAISPRKAHLMLLAAAFFWGAGNVANKTVLHHLDPYTTVALRCLLAAVVVAPFVWAERADAQPHKPWIGSAIGIALIFAAALVFQQLAYQTTTVTNASFLVNTATIVTPLVAWVALGDKPGLRILVAGVVTLAGAFLMSGMSLSSATINSGDGACLIAALLFALWMVALGHHAVTHGRPFATSFVQFAVTALVMLPIIAATQSPKLAAMNAALPDLLILGVFSTGAAFALQTYAQRYVTSSTAAILVSAESLFGAAGAYILLSERIPASGIIGAALILIAILMVATTSDIRPRRPAIPGDAPRQTGPAPAVLVLHAPPAFVSIRHPRRPPLAPNHGPAPMPALIRHQPGRPPLADAVQTDLEMIGPVA